jgi:transcriptional regulator GlxA family with amidase domain
MATSRRFSVAILIYSGFSNMVLACLLEPLRALRDQGRVEVDWTVVTVDDASACSSSGLRITPDSPCSAVERVDLLVVVAGYGYPRHAGRRNARILGHLARRAETVLGADTAAWLLASAGLLTEGRATVHWQVLSELAEAFPQLDVVHDRFVMEGRVWTCGGASTALDLMLQLIGGRFGPASAFDVSTLFLHDAARQEATSRGPARLSGKSSTKLSAILRDIATHIETPLPLNELAKRSGLATRSLYRLFLTELGMPPGQYYQLLRLSRARELAVETDLNLSEIAMRCGFSSASSLSKSFRKAFGYPIGKTRIQPSISPKGGVRQIRTSLS